MNFDINSSIFISFLVVNLAVGLWSSRGVTTISGYAVGDRNFATGTLVASIVATWIGGGFFSTTIIESYKEGLIFMSLFVADFLNFLFVGLFLAPRLSEFLGKISIAEAMGEMYGPKVRVITAIAGCIGVSGIIAIQLQIAGHLFEYAFGVPLFYGVVVSGIIITLYSSLGGIKAVTFTDVIQFITFSLVIPSIGLLLFKNFGSDVVMDTLTNNPKFNYKEVFTLDHPKFYYYASLFLWFLIPCFDPGIFQRVSMAKDILQVRHSFTIAARVQFTLALILGCIAILLVSEYPNLEGSGILKFIILDYNWVVGFKGIIIAAIMAMIMSTVDSYINSNSILMIHDLNGALHLKFIKNELLSTRICAALIGTIAIVIALRGGNFFKLLLWTSTCYMPIVTVPFIMTLLGFRSSNNSVLAGMAAGLATVLIWQYFDISTYMANVGALIPAMLANLVFLMGYHYLFKQKGGWVGIKDPNILVNLRAERKADRAKLWASIKNFSFIKLLRTNTPTGDGTIALLGITIIVLGFITAVNIPHELQLEYKSLVTASYISTLFFTASLISYPVWDPRWKGNIFIAACWNATILYALAGFGFFMVLFTGFGETQVIIYMTNILLIVSLINWRWALVLIVSGMIIVASIYKLYLPELLVVRGVSVESKILYMIFLVAGVVIAFLKPRQEYVADLETENVHLDHEVDGLGSKVTSLNIQVTDLNEKMVHYDQRIAEKDQEIDRLGATAQKILNNVNHELRLPVGNVVNFAEMLKEGLGKFDEEQLTTLSDEVYKNSTRLSSMILNMLDLANLNVQKVSLEKTKVNFSELVKDRVKICRKIYLQGKKLSFQLVIDPEIMISVDPNYMRQVVDNLVINAINFSEEGTIEVSVRKQQNSVLFMIEDQGIGIPQKDIYDIFTPFKMGSNAESKAEGRGVGLALCKSVVTAHDGVIKAESKAVGAIFRFVLPN